MIQVSDVIGSVKRCQYSEIQHFNGRAPKNQSHIYEGKIPINWFKLNDGEKVVGCYGLLVIGKEARFRGWFVDEDYRGRGVGLELAKSAMIEAKKMGLKSFEVKTSQIGLMNRLGIPPTGKTYKSFNGAQFRAVL